MLRFLGVVSGVFAIVLVAASASHAQQPIEPGIDLLTTTSDQTFEDLSQLDLLCPGCFVIGDPLIQLKGVPLDNAGTSCPGQNIGNTDTIVRRLQGTPPLLPGEQAVVPIQIVELHLQSVEPFQVDCQGEQQLWMLDVTIDQDLPQPVGQMQILKEHPNGGFFNSDLPVFPLLTFTRVDDCPVVEICQVTLPTPINFQTQGAPWAHQVPPGGAPVLEIPGCTSNFIAGVDPFGGNLDNNPGFIEAQMLRNHGVLPPLPPKLEQHTWQDAVHFTFWLTNPGGKVAAPIDALRMLRPRYIPMAPAGALPDSSVYLKSNSICNLDPLWTPSPTSWCRVNWDSTSALFRDEAWWFFPPVPVDSMAPEMDLVFSLPEPDPCLPPPTGAWYEIDVECYSMCTIVDTLTFRFHCDDGGTGSPVGTPGTPGIQIHSRLGQNYPNPFNPVTTIVFSLEQAQDVRLVIFNVQGEAVRTLVEERRDEGEHLIRWDGRDDAGLKIASGTYFYELQAGGRRESRKMIVLK